VVAYVAVGAAAILTTSVAGRHVLRSAGSCHATATGSARKKARRRS